VMNAFKTHVNSPKFM